MEKFFLTQLVSSERSVTTMAARRSLTIWAAMGPGTERSGAGGLAMGLQATELIVTRIRVVRVSFRSIFRGKEAE